MEQFTWTDIPNGEKECGRMPPKSAPQSKAAATPCVLCMQHRQIDGGMLCNGCRNEIDKACALDTPQTRYEPAMSDTIDSVLQCEICGRRSDQPDPRSGASHNSIRWFHATYGTTTSVVCGGPTIASDECLHALFTKTRYNPQTLSLHSLGQPDSLLLSVHPLTANP